MFFKLAMRNSRRSRKENGLFFASLVVSIVAFYIILALSHQDVMIFLKSLESDAVNSLLQIAAVFYVRMNWQLTVKFWEYRNRRIFTVPVFKPRIRKYL